MIETPQEYTTRKMKQVQDLLQEATMAGALANPIITDGMMQNQPVIEVKIVINESKLHAFRQIKNPS